MIDLSSITAFGTEGSGNQLKFWAGSNLVKLDSKYRESIKEVSACTLGTSLGLNCVKYIRDRFLYNGRQHWGVICPSYLNANDITFTLHDIINYYDINVPMSMSTLDYFTACVECINKFTSLPYDYITRYLGDLLVLDFLVANSDRHLSNIEFIRDADGRFRGAPYFDFGQSFFGKDSILTYKQLEQYSRRFKSLPFSTNPYKNLCLSKELLFYIVRSFNYSVEQLYNIHEPHGKIINFRYKLLVQYLNK